MGALTQNNPLIVGSSVGEIQAAQSSVLLGILGTSDVFSSANWISVGLANRSRAAAWAAACLPCDIQAAAVADNINSDTIIGFWTAAGNGVSLGIEITTDPNFYSGTPSTRARIQLEIRTGGGVVLRTDTFEFNPQNGQILSASVGITRINSQVLTIPTGGIDLRVLRIQLVFFPRPAGASRSTLSIFPDVVNGTDGFSFGSFIFETGDDPHAFIPNDNIPREKTNKFGSIPRQIIDINLDPDSVLHNAGALAYEPVVDTGKLFPLLFGDTLTLPNMPLGTFGWNSGEWLKVINYDAAGTANVDATAAGGIIIPDGIFAPINVLTFPFVLGGQNCYGGTFVWTLVTPGGWIMIDPVFGA